MNDVDFDLESLKDLDSDIEDQHFEKFLSDIIDGKKMPKMKTGSKKSTFLALLFYFKTQIYLKRSYEGVIVQI